MDEDDILRRRCGRGLRELFWQLGGLGPMMGQAAYFLVYAPEPVPAAIERYQREAARLFDVLVRRLSDRAFIVGDYSIAEWPPIRGLSCTTRSGSIWRTIRACPGDSMPSASVRL